MVEEVTVTGYDNTPGPLFEYVCELKELILPSPQFIWLFAAGKFAIIISRSLQPELVLKVIGVTSGVSYMTTVELTVSEHVKPRVV